MYTEQDVYSAEPVNLHHISLEDVDIEFDAE